MRTSLDLCFCLLTLCGITSVLYGAKVFVKEGSDAVLPCLISTEDLTGKIFDWKKDGQKEVFFYDSGIHYNNGLTGQDEQFKGRVSHFQDQLMNGNASIKIQNTKMADSGNYRCDFPHHSQTFYIELVVGASPKPYVTTLDETKDWSLLQCEVRGASPEPKVEWQDSSGNILPAEERQVSERGGRYYVTLKTNVTKTGRYRCVVTQEELSHQIHSETFVQLNEDLSREVELWRTATIVVSVLAAVLLAVAVVCCRCRYLWSMLFCDGCIKSHSHLRITRPPDNPEIIMPDDPDNITPHSHLRITRPPDETKMLMRFSYPRIMHPPEVTEIIMPDDRLQQILPPHSVHGLSARPPDDPDNISPRFDQWIMSERLWKKSPDMTQRCQNRSLLNNGDESHTLTAEDQSSDATESIVGDPGDESDPPPEPLK